MYKITKINTLTHELTVRHDDGTDIAMVIPFTHLGSNELKFEYINAQVSVHEAKSEVLDEQAQPAAAEPVKFSSVYMIPLCAAIFVIVMSLLLLKVA